MKLEYLLIKTENDFCSKKVDPNGTVVFDDIFPKRNSTYSGSEETEFYLSKLYAITVALKHHYPVIMDYFRDGELSSEKEEAVLREYSKFNNQIIFTATLKDEELGKYEKKSGITAIDYSANEDSHILNSKYNHRFKNILKSMMIDL